MKTNKIGLLLAAVFLYSLFAKAAFAINDDSILSQHVKEADGVTGQDTNSGSGIKTGHIQDGAVTDAKISGVISRSKLERYGKIAVVAQTGGDYADPLAAMNNLSTWCGTPSATNPCLLKIMPGVYNIGGGRLVMISYVDIEGSGENVTKILGFTNALGSDIGLVEGASNAELRSLTVENSGGYWIPKAILNINASPKLTNITVISTGSATANYGIKNSNSSPIMTNVTVYVSGRTCQGVVNHSSSSPRLTNVTVTAVSSDAFADHNASVGITNENSSPILNNVTVSASGGIYENYGMLNFTSTPTIINSSLSGNGASGTGVYNTTTGNTATIFNSIISGSDMNIRGGQAKCVNVVDASFNLISCQ